MKNKDLISKTQALKAITKELKYQEEHAIPLEDMDTGIISGLRRAAQIVAGIKPGEDNALAAGYMAGYTAARKEKEQAVVLIKSTLLLHSEDLAHVYNDLVWQKDKGVIMLQPGLEYIGTIPEDADIELVVKKIKEATSEEH